MNKLNRVSHKYSKSNIVRVNTENVIKVVKPDEKIISLKSSEKHSRTSSQDLKLQEMMSNIACSGSKYETKLKTAAGLVKKLKNLGFARQVPKKSKTKLKKNIRFLEKIRTNMFTDVFMKRLIFKSWIGLVNRKKMRKNKIL